MNITQFNDYQAAALRTAKEMGPRMDLIHSALGLAGEAGEFVDAVKRHVVYCKPLDRQNAAEEIGDILWFCALACETLNITMAEVASHNIDKLRQRYPQKYSDTHAAARLDKQADAALDQMASNARDLGLNYTTPPAQPAVPLTDEKISKILDDPNIAEMHQGNWLVLPYAFARAIEAAHGITAAPTQGETK